MRVTQVASETLNTRYFHTDNLGSISVITDENGLVQERLSYDAWGKRRFANGSDDPTDSITSQTTRGFTGQEELSVSGLVHLNGRVYDPLLARMTSPDPTVTDPTNPQGWNRYSYVGNDPLAFTDPNGFSWLSSFFHSVANFLSSNSIVRAVVQIAATIILSAIIPASGILLSGGWLATASAAGGAAIATGLSGGNLGQVLRSAAIAGATAFGFAVVGSATNAVAGQNFDLDAPHIQPQFGSEAYAFNVAGHALVGCASAAASGGSCESGALSGGVTAGAGPLINGQNFTTSLVENAVLGGAASVAGGGKFANGAITGAFGYLYNNLAGRQIGGAIGSVAAAFLGFETGPFDVALAIGAHYVGGAVGDWLTGPDAAEGADVATTTVGRYMSQTELDAMTTSGRVQESFNNGVTSVTVPPNPGLYRAAPTSDIFTQFDVPTSSLNGVGTGTAKIYGPNSIFGPRLGITEMPPATNIVIPQ